MDISNVLYHFLSASNDYVEAEIIGKRNRRVGLAMPAEHNDILVEKIFDTKFPKRRKLFLSLELIYQKKRMSYVSNG